MKNFKSMRTIRIAILGSIILIIAVLLIHGIQRSPEQIEEEAISKLPEKEQALIGEWSLKKTRLESKGPTKVSEDDQIYSDTKARVDVTFKRDKTAEIYTEKDGGTTIGCTWSVDEYGNIKLKYDKPKDLPVKFTSWSVDPYGNLEAKVSLDKSTFVWFLFKKD